MEKSSSATTTTTARVVVAATKTFVAEELNACLVAACASALAARGTFTIALSGGSLVNFLSSLTAAFEAAKIDPHYDCWHVLLADERCVPVTHEDSNLGAIRANFLSRVPIPANQVYGIDEGKLSDASARDVALAYDKTVRNVLELSGGSLDLAVLGFGPDGHTCSLFPEHELLHTRHDWVAHIDDSPKPPLRRVSLTFVVLNQHTRHVLLCGAGSSKRPILKRVFATVKKDDDKNEKTASSSSTVFRVVYSDPPPYPCAMVAPLTDDTESTLTWVVDADAMVDDSCISQNLPVQL